MVCMSSVRIRGHSRYSVRICVGYGGPHLNLKSALHNARPRRSALLVIIVVVIHPVRGCLIAGSFVVYSCIPFDTYTAASFPKNRLLPGATEAPPPWTCFRRFESPGEITHDVRRVVSLFVSVIDTRDDWPSHEARALNDRWSRLFKSPVCSSNIRKLMIFRNFLLKIIRTWAFWPFTY